MNFKEYFQIVEEGMMKIPQYVWNDVLDYYTEVYKIYRKGLKQKALLSEKEFPINFKGTNFEFLNDLTPPPTILIRFTNIERNKKENENSKEKIGLKASYFLRLPAEKLGKDSIIEKSKGAIYLNLDADYIRIRHLTIEHEMAHFVQALIQKKTVFEKVRNKLRDYLKKEPSYEHILHDVLKTPNYKEMIGGLPSKKLIPKNLDITGKLINGGDEQEQPKHETRPEEYYPRLITAMRQLERAYLKEIKDTPELRNDPYTKKKFFDEVYNAIKNGEEIYETPITKSKIHLERFTKFKEISTKLYNKIISIAYDAFVNKDI